MDTGFRVSKRRKKKEHMSSYNLVANSWKLMGHQNLNFKSKALNSIWACSMPLTDSLEFVDRIQSWKCQILSWKWQIQSWKWWIWPWKQVVILLVLVKLHRNHCLPVTVGDCRRGVFSKLSREAAESLSAMKTEQALLRHRARRSDDRHW